MVEDKELDELERIKREAEAEKKSKSVEAKEEEVVFSEEEKATSIIAAQSSDENKGGSIPTVFETDFKERMDEVKTRILKDASVSDEKFVDTIKKNVKEAAITHTEVEQEKAALAKQQVVYEQEKLNTKQEENANTAVENKWENRQKRRQFHYDGVKPIMTFVGIKEPMNLFILYFLTCILIWFFLIAKLWNGTIGALLVGACDSNRSKAAKGLIWTCIAIFVLLAIGAGVYIFLKWQGIIVPKQ